MSQSTRRRAIGTHTAARELKIAHSPDADDAFMFYALATKKIRPANLRLTHVLKDIETLNRKAFEDAYDVTAISFHAYAYLTDSYVLLPCGASIGAGYGPLVVARTSPQDTGLKHRRVAVPGRMTTAYLVLKLFEADIEPVFMPFDKIPEAVANGNVDAGVLIHEAQLTYASLGLRRVVDLGKWWQDETKLPLPLGANAIRRSLDPTVQKQFAEVMKESILYSLEHREEALNYALQFARGLDSSTADRFVSMYVNQWTLDYGDEGRRAVHMLLHRAYAAGLVRQEPAIEFVS